MCREILITGNWRTLLLQLLATPRDPRAGAAYAEQRVVVPILRVIAAIPETGGNLEVESLNKAAWKELADRVTTAGFATNCEDSLALIEAVLNAEEVCRDG